MAAKNTPEHPQQHDRSNVYDKIMQEIYHDLLPFVTSLGGQHYDKLEDVKLSLQYTLEKKADLLQKVYLNGTLHRILHVEFQSNPDPNMQKRMLLYHALLYEKYSVPVEQHVVYMGAGPMRMEATIEHQGLHFTYNLRNIAHEPASYFLKSQHSALVLLAILANPGQMTKEALIAAILQRFDELETDELVLRKRRVQLEVLSKLRNLQPNVVQIAKQMPITLDYRTDIRFMEGQAEGKAEGKAEGQAERAHKTAVMMKQDGEPLAKIMRYTGLSAAEIEQL